MELRDSLNNPRLKALTAMKASVPPDTWAHNQSIIASWRSELKAHPLMNHPIQMTLLSGVVGREHIRQIHLDYRHAIVKVFTDALTMAMVQSRQMEPRLPPGSKAGARFLLTLNALDELGFQPGLDDDSYYRGNPICVHYPLFERVLDQLGVQAEQRVQFTPSQPAQKLLEFIEDSFFSYEGILTLLAVAEIQVISFSPALRGATKALGINVEDGYYFVHGTSSDTSVAASDDDHENDLWNALAQACTPEHFPELRTLATTYMDLWQEFWDYQNKYIRHDTEELLLV